MDFDTSHRLAEEDTVDNLSTICYQSNGWWVSKYCNEIDILESANKVQSTISKCVKYSTNASRMRFKLNVNVELSDVHNIPEVVKFHVD